MSSTPSTLVSRATDRGEVPIIVALDGVTDPRNLGGDHPVDGGVRRARRDCAAAPLGGRGRRRAWKTSAGAAARTPVAMAPNLTQTLKSLQAEGLFRARSRRGRRHLAARARARRSADRHRRPAARGKGLSRIVSETCDAIVSIPHLGGDRVAQRRHCGKRDALRGGAPARSRLS